MKSIWAAGFLLLLITVTSGCQRFDQIDKYDLKIADSIIVLKTGNHQVFEGSRVFMVVPDNYAYVPSLLRFQKDTNIYIQAIENPSLNFFSVKDGILSKVEELKSKGMKSYYSKEFKLQEFDAFLIYGPDNLAPGYDEMVLMFGDEKSSVILSAKFPTDSIRVAGEIRDALLTAYLDTEHEADLSGIMPYDYNLSGTQFKLHSATSVLVNFTIDGLGDPNDPTSDLISIIAIAGMPDFETRKAYAQSMIPQYKANGIIIPKYDEQEVLINNVRAYEISFKSAYNGRPLKCYQIVLGNDKTTLLFIGQVGVDKNELYDQVIQISQTIRLK